MSDGDPGRAARAVIRRRRALALLAVGVLVVTLIGVVVASGDESANDKYTIEYDGSDVQLAEGPTAQPEKAKEPKPEERLTAADLGGLLITGFSGQIAPQSVLEKLKRGEAAGVIIMGENVDTVEKLQSLTASFRAAASEGGQPEPLIMVDQEGGEVKRFLSAAPDISAKQMSSLSGSEVESIGLKTGKDLIERGANVDLAPVADVVGSTPNFLGTRAFTGSASSVASKACAFSAGLLAAGVGATLKHFPGLGSAGSVNTDNGAVTITSTRSALSQGWTPYVECANESRTMVMVSSAEYPKAYGGRPALFESEMYQDLRDSVGFEGVVITDALNAVALATEESIAVDALRAGADLLLYMDEPSVSSAYTSLAAALKNDDLDAGEISEKLARVRRLREQLK